MQNNGFDWTALTLLTVADNAQQKAELDKLIEWSDKIKQYQIERKYAKTQEEQNYYTDLISLYQQKVDEFWRNEEVKKKKRKTTRIVFLIIGGVYALAMIGILIWALNM